MSTGWVLIHRQIMDNPLWNEKPFSKGQAWIDLLLLANHKDNDVLIGNNIVTIKRGQFHTSESILSKRWGWGRKKTNLFLSLLENAKMCTALRTSKGTTITIENYATYQEVGTAVGTAVGTSEEQRTHSARTQTNNVKNEKNTPKGVYGTFSNVKLFPAEYDRLVKDYGEKRAKEGIDFLSAYRKEKGYRNKDDNLSIRRWVFDALDEQARKRQQPKKEEIDW